MDYVRVKDRDTGHKFSLIDNGVFDEAAYELLDEPATDYTGDPLPPEHAEPTPAPAEPEPAEPESSAAATPAATDEITADPASTPDGDQVDPAAAVAPDPSATRASTLKEKRRA